MINLPILRNAVTDYLREHSELHGLSARQLAKTVSEPKAGYQTWYAARKTLNLPAIPRNGLTYATKTRKQERKAAFAIYPNTYKIVVDTQHLKVIFHGEGGFKIAQKTSKKALAASLRLFRLAKFVTREHDTENGIMVLTFEHQSQAVAA